MIDFTAATLEKTNRYESFQSMIWHLHCHVSSHASEEALPVRIQGLEVILQIILICI
jgi:hypothetical protein